MMPVTIPQMIRQYRQKTNWILPLFYKLSSRFPRRFTCPTTGRKFWARALKVWRVRGKAFAQVSCKYCDARGLKYTDSMYDKGYPQIHILEMK